MGYPASSLIPGSSISETPGQPATSGRELKLILQGGGGLVRFLHRDFFVSRSGTEKMFLAPFRWKMKIVTGPLTNTGL